eukprot:COSAG05_NODE_1535_length_4614_cov_342.629900_2_plen_95_part_00
MAVDLLCSAATFQFCEARVAASDERKLAAFESLGFGSTESAASGRTSRVIYGGDGGDGGIGYFGPALGDDLIVLTLPLQQSGYGTSAPPHLKEF